MFSTKSVQSLRKLFAGYHEPPSLSKQQSQKLLDGLKTSFRDQLDREYGRSPNHPSVSGGTTSGDAERRFRRPAASVHLKSILSNPLFSYNKEAAATTSTASSSSSSPLTSALSLPQRDPMDVFDHAVSKGMMTLEAATGCLVAKRREQSESICNDAHVLQGPSSDTALRIVQWLRSSGEDNDLEFLDKKTFIGALAPFLVAEKMDAVAWEWIVRAMNKSATTTTAGVEEKKLWMKRASFLLSQLVRIKSQAKYGNLDAAIQMILDAEKAFEQNPMLPKLLINSWRSVSWLSTVESFNRTAPSEQLFNAHMAMADRLPQRLEIERAHLHLHHPTHPDHIPALEYFHDKENMQKLAHAAGPEKWDLTHFAHSRGMEFFYWISFLGRDTVNHLKQSGRNKEAREFTELLRTELSSIFGENLSHT